MVYGIRMKWAVREMVGSYNCSFFKKTEEAAGAIDAFVE